MEREGDALEHVGRRAHTAASSRPSALHLQLSQQDEQEAQRGRKRGATHESNMIVSFSPTPERTISSSASSDPIAPSTWRPAWFDTTMPSTPGVSAARRASSTA